MGYRVVGQNLPRSDAYPKVTGGALYVADLKRPGMLHAKALRSAYAHARILGLDVSEAASHPGVRAIVTAQDVPCNRFGFTHLDQPVLAGDKVRYRGDALAVVAATSEEAAAEAVEKIRVTYEPLPVVFDPVEAMQPQAPKIHGKTNVCAHLKIRFGDIEKGWMEADAVIKENLSTPMVEHAPMEPHGAIAEVAADGELILWVATQRPFVLAGDLAKILRIPQSRIRVAAPTVGAGFGGKNEITLEPALCLLAMKTGRPVKMVFTREEEFQASTVRHPYVMHYKTGVKADGTIVARQVEIISDCGPYVSWGASTLSKACIHAAGPYRIPNVWVDGYLVYTNNNLGGAMRGFGVPQVGFAYEVHTDTVARTLGLDPLTFRLRNLLEDGSSLPTGQRLEKVSLKETVRRAMELAGWKIPPSLGLGPAAPGRGDVSEVSG